MDNDTANYFHGKIDRPSAEARLVKFGKPGSFILRESDKRANSYVLSYHGRKGIGHFRINHAYGSYFVGGRKFDSIADLVYYYTYTSGLYNDERLLYPVPPPEPISSHERVFIAILPYTTPAHSDELSFEKGDLFILQNDLTDGWLWCRDVKSGQSGMISSQLLEEIKGDVDPNEVYPWFHKRLSKADAVNKLAEVGPGSFLIRPSDNSPGNYTLFYHVGATVQRYLIVKNPDHRYTMGGECFDSLGQIVDKYQKEHIIDGHKLQFPVTTTMSRSNQLSESTLSTSMRALEVRDKPQDVYHTVKMSREAAKKKQNSEVKGWMYLKKGDLTKKWKTYFFVLNSRDRHLYYYEKPLQTKPKGLIDLSYSIMYQIHQSLFESTQCLQLVEKCLPCFANHFYLKCEDDFKQFRLWCSAITRFTLPNQAIEMSVSTSINRTGDTGSASSRTRSEDTTPNKSEVFRNKRSLYLHFVEAHSLRSNHPCFMIAFNRDVMIAKLKVKTSPVAIFNDDGYFAFEDLPSDVGSLCVLMHPANKKIKSTLELPQFSIDLAKLRAEREQLSHWFELRSTNSQDAHGFIRIRMISTNELVMSIDEYQPLLDLVTETNIELINILSQICHREHLALARSLSNILKYKKISIKLLRSLINQEVSVESDVCTLFRTSTLTTALIESYMRSVSEKALTKGLREPVKRLLDDKICCELNPSKLDSHNLSSKACENLQNLLDLLDELVGNIYDSVGSYPPTVRFLLACLQQQVEHKWPNEQFIRTRVVSGFLFLRLICPTVLNPKQFNLVNETPSENAIRNLTLVTKCLQNLANLIETAKSNNSLAQSVLSTIDDYAVYPSYQMQPIDQAEYSNRTNSILAFILSPQIESWMEVVNPFILKNKIGMVKFIDELCNVDINDSSLMEEPNIDCNNNGDVDDCSANDEDYADPCVDLASLHAICDSYMGELERLSETNTTAKSLAIALSRLSQRKQYFNNLKKSAQYRINSTLL